MSNEERMQTSPWDKKQPAERSKRENTSHSLWQWVHQVWLTRHLKVYDKTMVPFDFSFLRFNWPNADLFLKCIYLLYFRIREKKYRNKDSKSPSIETLSNCPPCTGAQKSILVSVWMQDKTTWAITCCPGHAREVGIGSIVKAPNRNPWIWQVGDPSGILTAKLNVCPYPTPSTNCLNHHKSPAPRRLESCWTATSFSFELFFKKTAESWHLLFYVSLITLFQNG